MHRQSIVVKKTNYKNIFVVCCSCETIATFLRFLHRGEVEKNLKKAIRSTQFKLLLLL